MAFLSFMLASCPTVALGNILNMSSGIKLQSLTISTLYFILALFLLLVSNFIIILHLVILKIRDFILPAASCLSISYSEFCQLSSPVCYHLMCKSASLCLLNFMELLHTLLVFFSTVTTFFHTHPHGCMLPECPHFLLLCIWSSCYFC